MFQTVWKKLSRHAVPSAVFFPALREAAQDRTLDARPGRGPQDGRCRLGSTGRPRAGAPGGSRHSRFYQIKFGLPEGMLVGFDNMHRANPEKPLKVFFTHGNYLKDYTV